MPTTRRTLFQTAAAALLLIPLSAQAEETLGYDIEVSDLTAKVGQNTTWRITLRPKPGARILSAYSNRVGQLSSFDDGVAFDAKSFPGVAHDGAMIFDIALRPTKPGTHPINGVFRVGYMEGTDYMAMVSLPLIAKVIATE